MRRVVWAGVVLAVLVASGCGRIGFAPTTNDGMDDGRPVSQGSMTRRFGERPDADVQGVCADTWLDNSLPDTNYGASDTLQSDPGEIPLVRFALDTALAPSVQVATARLFLTTTDNSSPGGRATVHRMREAWDAGVEDQAPGAASWDERVPGTSWMTPGAGAPSSDDIVLGSFMPSDTETEYVIDIDVTTVKAWVETAATNFGFVIRIDAGNGADFHSCDAPSPSTRPMLEISYDP